MALQSSYSNAFEDAPSAGPAFSDADIKAYVTQNINNPQAIADAAQQYGVSAADLSRATGYDTNTVNSYFGNAGISFGQPAAQTYTSTNEQGAPIYDEPAIQPPAQQTYNTAYGAPPPPVFQSQPVTPPPAPTAQPVTLPPPVTTSSYQDPAQVQQQIIADERKRSTDGIASLGAGQTTVGSSPKPVDLGNGTYRTSGGTIIDSQGRPVAQGTTLQPIISPPPTPLPAYFLANPDVAAEYAKNSYGLTPEQYANTHYANYGQYEQRVSPDGKPAVIQPPPSRNDIIQNYVSDVIGNNNLSQFEKVNNIMEAAQKNKVSTEELQKIYGKDIVNNYLKDYGSNIKSFVTNTLADTTKSDFDKVAVINQAAKKYGLDPAEIAQYSGLNKKGVDQVFTAFDSGLASLAKGWDTAKTTAGTDPAALSTAEANKAKTMLALQSKYQVSDDDLAKAMGSTAKDVSSYLAPVKEAPKTLEALMNNTQMTATEIRAKIEELKSNPAVNGIYSAALEKFSDKASKDYSGEYGGKKFESLNPIAVSNVMEQLKAQQAAGTAQYYQGGAKDGNKGGFGSLDSMTEDMAKNLVAAGITDIRQVGEVPIYVPAEVIGRTYNGKPVRTINNEDGTTTTGYYAGTGQVDNDGEEYQKFVEVPKDAKIITQYGQDDNAGNLLPVDASKVTKDKDGKMVVQSGTTAGNKLTGEPLSKASNYSERTTGNSWSGTYKGKGNTGYNVQFKDGNPVFYTTGASSSDMQQLAPLLAMASFIPGAAPFVAAINAAYAASEGNWKQAILSALPAAGPLANMAGASASTVANIGTASKIANVANAISNKDILGLAMSGTGLASDQNLFGESAFNPKANVLGDFSTKDLLSGASIAKALDSKDLTSLANIGAQMSGNENAATAAKGLAIVKALESKNPMAIAQVVQKLNLTKDAIGQAGGGLTSLPGLIKNGGKDTLTDKTAFDGLNGSLVAKMLNQQPPAIRAAMLKKMTQAA